jgi:hypothetical protein
LNSQAEAGARKSHLRKPEGGRGHAQTKSKKKKKKSKKKSGLQADGVSVLPPGRPAVVNSSYLRIAKGSVLRVG